MTKVFERENVKVEVPPPAVRRDYASVRVDQRGLALDGARVLSRDAIASVSVVLGERTSVRIGGAMGAKGAKGGPTRFRCTFTDPRDASALVTALGRDPERTTTEIALEAAPLMRGFEPLAWWKALGIVGFALIAWLPLLLVAARSASIQGEGLGAAIDRALEIGTDGLRVRALLGKYFLAYREITRVEARGGAIVLTRRSGPEVTLRVMHGDRLAEAVAQVERARAAAAASGPVDRDAAELLRGTVGGGGATSDAVAALRALGDVTTGSYREARIPRERLLAVVEDPRAGGPTRARAAIALSGALAEEERARIRVAADATVSPHVRVALDAVNGGSDAQLAQRLARLREEDEEEGERERE